MARLSLSLNLRRDLMPVCDLPQISSAPAASVYQMFKSLRLPDLMNSFVGRLYHIRNPIGQTAIVWVPDIFWAAFMRDADVQVLAEYGSTEFYLGYRILFYKRNRRYIV